MAQEKPLLTVQKIMRDPKTWIGTSPSSPFWSEDGNTLYFNWNPQGNLSDSLYKVHIIEGKPVLVPSSEQSVLSSSHGTYSADRNKKLYTRDGDIYLLDIKRGKSLQLTNTVTMEINPTFSKDEQKIFFTSGDNLYAINLTTFQLHQLTDFRSGKSNRDTLTKKSAQSVWLEQDQLSLMSVFQKRKTTSTLQQKSIDRTKSKKPKAFYFDSGTLSDLQISPDERFITFLIKKTVSSTQTLVPNYVTPSGYTTTISARPKVGNLIVDQQTGIYHIEKDTTYFVSTDKLYKIQTQGPSMDDSPQTKISASVTSFTPLWSSDGHHAIIGFRSNDNKDRWIGLLDMETGATKILDHQHDDAWIGGPGIGYESSGDIGWMPDDHTIWFHSEESGYSHLYTVDINTSFKKALTSGNFEINDARISIDKKRWYFESNIRHPGDWQLCSMPLTGGKIEMLTTMQGKVTPYFSPNEKKIAFLYSSSNKPWELFVMDNPVLSKRTPPKQLTTSVKSEFTSYPWRTPEIISFKARDSIHVYARLYKPAHSKPGGPAVIFVHGAGYLQNAHYWWSYYFREYMFHNLLADLGYTVLDIDYRGSAGYGRDFRTGIYRHMGGKDLTDHVDGVQYLIEHHNVDPKRIGIYGGSYGGFITLMAMFTQPDVFAAGAALRSVTDWAHYNHPYTSNILNTPIEDSVAFRKSSPIYYAEGLKGALLMCHGVVDTNVHFQDIVRLAQRLIELEKENWELALYPIEDHAFQEASSWTDEYRRILNLFEINLK